MSPRRLTNLSIVEVSTVDKGAAEGARVVVRKQNQERNDKMSEQHGVVSVAKRASSAIESGEIDQVTLAKLQQRLAQEQFPNEPTMGHALAKFFATPHGAEMLNRGVRATYEQTQKRLAKNFDDTGPITDEDEIDDTDDAAGQPLDKHQFDAAVKALVAMGHSPDASMSAIHRLERKKKLGF